MYQHGQEQPTGEPAETLDPTTHPRSHVCSDTGCSRPKSSEFLGLKTTVMWSAPGTKWPSLTTSALLSCPAGAWVLGAVLFLSHPRDWGLRLDQGSYVAPSSFPKTEPDGFLPCAKSPGSPWSWWPLLHSNPVHPGPLLAACQPAASNHRPPGTVRERREQHGLYKMGGGPGASLVMIHRCTPFKPRSHPLGDLIPSSSLFLGQPGRKKA